MASRKAKGSEGKTSHHLAQPLGISRATVEGVDALMAKAPELVERVAAKARQREHGGTAPGRRKADTSGKFPEVIKV